MTSLFNNGGFTLFLAPISRIETLRDDEARCGGFTLIELLVVVLIIGILAGVALPQYQKAVMKSRYAALKAITKSLADAQQVYHLANGTYATAFDELSIDIGGTSHPTYPQKYTYFPWGACKITTDYCQCENNQINMSYRINYTNQVQFCGTYADNTIQNQICKQETGTTTPTQYEQERWYRYK